METLKNEIKKLAETQSVLRDQRKSVYNRLERTVEPRKAAWEHAANREQLRIMYAAQAILRGKTIEEIHQENPTKAIDKLSILQLRAQIEKLVEIHQDEKVVRFSE